MNPINMDSITFHQLQICITIAEQGSFTDAANVLFISQPSISKQVANLEQNLGVKLFTRGKNTSVTTTEAGRMLITQWQSMLSAFFHSATEAAQMQRQTNQVVSLYINPSMDKNVFLEPIRRAFMEHYPEIYLRVNLGSAKIGTEKLLAGTSDILIYNPFQQELNDNEKLQEEWLVHTPCVVGMLDGNPLAGREKLCWEDLKEMRFVLPNSPSFIREVDLQCSQVGFHPQIAHTCRYFSAIADNICKNNEVFITDRFMAAYGCKGYTYFDLPSTTSCGLLIRTRKDEKNEFVLYLKKLLKEWFETC